MSGVSDEIQTMASPSPSSDDFVSHVLVQDINRSVAHNSASREFVLFPKLPLEIRLLIWESVCLQPRFIDLWTFRSEMEMLAIVSHEEGGDPVFYYYTHTGPPAILHISQEARQVGLCHYHYEFGTHAEVSISGPSRGIMSISTPPRIYVNWACDIISPIQQAQGEVPDLPDIIASKYHNIHRFAVDEAHVRRLSTTFKPSWLKDLLCPAPEESSTSLREIVIYYCNYKYGVPAYKGEPPQLIYLDENDLQIDVPGGLGGSWSGPKSLLKARELLLREIEVLSDKWAPEGRVFVTPTISFASLDV
ncbi:hypothetical protein VTL71DRAFT_3348 [Oculimacula yallundae]|uniref:2EXR domain-containing protein n=1 Tax=Oculimacula yallundae TaxID=86028 RepID=A0ABR4C931_9HELO